MLAKLVTLRYHSGFQDADEEFNEKIQKAIADGAAEVNCQPSDIVYKPVEADGVLTLTALIVWG